MKKILSCSGRIVALSDSLALNRACSYATLACADDYRIDSAVSRFIHDQVKEPGGIGFQFLVIHMRGLVQNLVQTSAERTPFRAPESGILL